MFMGIVLLCLILGLALSIERIIYLNLATTNTTKLLTDVENALGDKRDIDSIIFVLPEPFGPMKTLAISDK